MSYIVTTKIGYDNGVLTRNPIAFPFTNGNVEVFNSWCDWTKWTADNYNEIVNQSISIADHFTSNPNCYEGKINVESINGMDVTIIETI